ncbi:hypothetical protein ACNF49_39985 [Actinomadura sp. ATCC 39365]
MPPGWCCPEPADLSGDLGDGVRGVRLPEASVAVARLLDGAVVLHHQGRQIRRGRAHRPHGCALAVGLLVLFHDAHEHLLRSGTLPDEH